MLVKKIIIFGTGSSAFSFVRSFKELEIICFVDNDETKQYSLYNNRPVLPPSILKNIIFGKCKIVVASEFYDEIASQMKDFGLSERKDFFPDLDLLIEKTDVFLISYMKCGRTWLRFIIGKIFENFFDLKEIDVLYYSDCYSNPNVKAPIITSYHDDNPHQKKFDELEREKNKYRNNKIMFLVRDPRDVAVSLYYHMKYRVKNYEGNIDDFVMEKIPGIVQYFNIWHHNMANVKDFILIKYEDLKSQNVVEIKRICQFLGFTNLNNEFYQIISRESSFEVMKSYEIENKAANPQLHKSTVNGNKALKVRKGIVGGYINELKDSTINFINAHYMSKLSSIKGYETYGSQ